MEKKRKVSGLIKMVWSYNSWKVLTLHKAWAWYLKTIIGVTKDGVRKIDEIENRRIDEKYIEEETNSIIEIWKIIELISWKFRRALSFKVVHRSE